MDESSLAKGRGLKINEARGLEDRLNLQPNDLKVRLKLIGYYGANDKTNTERIKHVLWMIHHYPASDIWVNPELHFSIRVNNNLDLTPLVQGWLQQIERDIQNGKVLANAGHFLYFIDEDLALTYLEKAERLLPDDITTPDSLSNAYFKHFRDASERIKRSMPNWRWNLR